MHGAVGQPRPDITVSGGHGLVINSADATIRHLEVQSSGLYVAIYVLGADGTDVDRVIGRSADQTACYIAAAVSVTITNSYCVSSGAANGVLLDAQNVSASADVVHVTASAPGPNAFGRSEEHTSELQSRQYLVCRLLLEKKKNEPVRNLLLSHLIRCRTTLILSP